MTTGLFGGTARILLVGGILVVLASPALAQFRGGPPSPDRMFGFMDRNRDGYLDGDELRRVPGPFREALEEAGVDPRRGISRDRFLREAPRMMESARRRMEESRGRGDSDRRRGDDRDRRDDRDRDEDRRRREPEKPQRPARKKREPVALTIPEQFTTIDQDADGQVAFYEWRQTQHGTISQFRAIDRNGDGFLTPFELKLSLEQPAGETVPQVAAGPQPGTIQAPPAATRAPATPVPTPPPATPRPAAPAPAASQSAPVDMDSPEAARAKYTFRLLDRDRDGSVTPEEWQRSRRLRPMFEAAGVDLSKPMTVEQFVPTYLKINKS